jgi:hypothetical protein
MVLPGKSVLSDAATIGNIAIQKLYLVSRPEVAVHICLSRERCLTALPRARHSPWSVSASEYQIWAIPQMFSSYLSLLEFALELAIVSASRELLLGTSSEYPLEMLPYGRDMALMELSISTRACPRNAPNSRNMIDHLPSTSRLTC